MLKTPQKSEKRTFFQFSNIILPMMKMFTDLIFKNLNFKMVGNAKKNLLIIGAMCLILYVK